MGSGDFLWQRVRVKQKQKRHMRDSQVEVQTQFCFCPSSTIGFAPFPLYSCGFSSTLLTPILAPGNAICSFVSPWLRFQATLRRWYKSLQTTDWLYRTLTVVSPCRPTLSDAQSPGGPAFFSYKIYLFTVATDKEFQSRFIAMSIQKRATEEWKQIRVIAKDE